MFGDIKDIKPWVNVPSCQLPVIRPVAFKDTKNRKKRKRVIVKHLTKYDEKGEDDLSQSIGIIVDIIA